MKSFIVEKLIRATGMVRCSSKNGVLLKASLDMLYKPPA